jgi:hypothetical protein
VSPSSGKTCSVGLNRQTYSLSPETVFCLRLQVKPVQLGSRQSYSLSPETGFCLRLQMEPTQLGPIDRASPYLRRLVFVSVFRWNLLSWAQSIELVPVSGDCILSPSSGGTYSVGPSR